MIEAGELNSRISIQRDSITRQSGAERRITGILLSCWAKVEGIRGNETWRNEQVNAEVDWRFTVRYAAARQVEASDRVVMRNQIFEIKAVIRDEVTRDSAVLMCKSINV